MSALSYLTKCGFCAQTFTQGPPLIGEEAPARAQRMINGLLKHLKTLHPEEWQKVEAQGKAASAFRAICNFDFQDPWMQNFRDQMRHVFFVSLQRFQIDDAHIAKMVAKLELPPEYEERVINSHQALRNVLQEIAPPAAEPAQDSAGAVQ